MARYEFSDEKSNKFWEIILEGSTFTVKFGRIGTAGQVQFKHFMGPDEAKAEHDKLVAEKLKKGYKPAQEPPKEQPKEKPEPKIPPFHPAKIKEPFRKDVYVYNDATGFLITSRSQGGRYLADTEDAEWAAAVANGDLMPVELYQDDSLIIRVAVGGGLTPEEEADWVGRLERPLRIPDGKLALCGGFEFVGEMFDVNAIDDAEDEASDEYHWKQQVETYVKFVEVPKGDYLATLYTMITAPNGAPMMRGSTPEEEEEKIGAFFRRTRPGQPFPAWLHNLLMAYPNRDPGHENEWEGKKIIPEREALFVSFLVHLVPVPQNYIAKKPELDGGWFFRSIERRRPDVCPMGLAAEDVEGYPEPKAPAELHTFEIYSRVAERPFSPVEGGAVKAPLNEIKSVFSIPWLCSVHIAPQIMISLPPGAQFPLEEKEIENVRVKRDGRALDLRFGGEGSMFWALKPLDAAGARLAGLPDGAVVELSTSGINDDEETDPPPGLHRYRGVVKGGQWAITETFPKVTGDTLIQAIALAKEMDRGTVTALDEAEAKEIIRMYMKSLGRYMGDNPVVRDGLAIRFKEDDRRLTLELAGMAMKLRHEDTWTFPDMDDDEDDDGEDFPIFPVREANPPQKDLILSGEGGREYFASDIWAMDGQTTLKADATDKAMKALGFHVVGDLVCSAFPNLVLRGYSTADGSAWGALMSASGGRGAVEFITYFEKDGASLTTTTNALSFEDVKRKSFKTAMPGKEPKELWEAHKTRQVELEKEYGAPAKRPVDIKALAADVEKSVKRQMGG